MGVLGLGVRGAHGRKGAFRVEGLGFTGGPKDLYLFKESHSKEAFSATGRAGSVVSCQFLAQQRSLLALEIGSRV